MSFPTIPTVASGDLLSSTTSPASTTHTFPNLSSLRGGAGPQAGDLLIAIIVQYQGGTANAEFGTWGASFTEMLDDALGSGTGNGAIGIARKVATGSESGPFTVTSAHSFKSVQFLLRIPAGTWHGTTVPGSSGSTRASGTVADPASFDPSGWAAEDTLWIAVAGQTETSTTGSPPTLDSPPANYTGQLIVARAADAVGDITAGVAFRQVNASSEDVGVWTATNANRGNGIAAVIAVRPAIVLAKAQVAWADFEIPGASATPKAGTDSGSGGAQASSLAASLSRAESASGTETSALQAVATVTDSGTGSEVSAVRVPKSGTDTGAGADASAEHADYTRTEAGSGAESSAVQQHEQVTASTTGSGSESSSLHATTSRAETGSGVDTSTVQTQNAKQGSDLGSGADASSLRCVATTAEAGAGTDASSIQQGAASKAGSDAGSGSEQSNLVVSHVKNEVGAGIDLRAIFASLSRVDAGTGTETALRLIGIATGDSGTAADASFLAALTLASDFGSVTQTAAVLALLASAGDAGVGADLASVWSGGLPPARMYGQVVLNKGAERSTIQHSREKTSVTSSRPSAEVSR